jgi:FkbM family methyltransferase
MHFVSYAQNNEDVMLFRALKDVGQGYYVDVGAYDPLVDSVTQAFYERGWSGINIEPVAASLARVQAARPRDINLHLAVSNQIGHANFHVASVPGLSSLWPDADVLQLDLQPVTVATSTLNQILEEHPLPAIHFLKIDAEGAEQAVLESIDLRLHRPWIILAEATRPHSNYHIPQPWESIITNQGYDPVYFDGLNRFYVAHEQAHLRDAFRTPPNVFDLFIRHSHLVTHHELHQTQQELNRTQQELALTAHQLHQTQQELNRWRNVRWTTFLAHKLARNPSLRHWGQQLLRRFPQLRNRLGL